MHVSQWYDSACNMLQQTMDILMHGHDHVWIAGYEG